MSAAVALQAQLPEQPRNVSYPSPHVSPYGFYISEICTFNGHTYNVGSADCSTNGNTKYGGYGYIVQNNWEDTKGHMAEYISYHGPSSGVDWIPSMAKAKTEIGAGHPFVVLNSLTSAGHYITCIGYFTDKYTLIFNDPYGNKNTPGYPSYDGARVFYDWPGYNNGYQNLNTAWCFIWARASVGPTPTPSPTPAPGTDVIVDNDDGSPAYTETGTWTTSTSTGYNGLTYRFAAGGTSATASWTGALAVTGNYDVFVYYRTGTNRCTAAQFSVAGADGTHTVAIDQQSNGLTWVTLGRFPLNAGNNTVVLDAQSSTPAANVVIADAVRFTLSSAPTPTPSPSPTASATPSATPSPTASPSPTDAGFPAGMLTY